MTSVRKYSRLIVRPLLAAFGFAAILMSFATPAAAMTFEMITGASSCGGKTCILASGLIDKDSVGQFQAFAKKHQIEPGAVVALNSEGGVLLYGLALGDQIRKAGLSTTLQDSASGQPPTECASACVFTFMGGVERTVGKGARVGVHQIYSDTQARDSLSVSDAQYLTSLVALHIDKMGGRLGILILALRTSPDAVHWFSASELSGLSVTTADRPTQLASN
jgi:hypothetical protein